MNEIRLSHQTGLTVTAQLFSGATPVGGPLALAEIGQTGEYLASVPQPLAAGEYLAVFSANSEKVASGLLYWDGEKEVTPHVLALALAQLPTQAGLTELQSEQLRKVAQLHGVGATLVVTETARVAGDVHQTINTNKDGETTVSTA